MRHENQMYGSPAEVLGDETLNEEFSIAELHEAEEIDLALYLLRAGHIAAEDASSEFGTEISAMAELGQGIERIGDQMHQAAPSLATETAVFDAFDERWGAAEIRGEESQAPSGVLPSSVMGIIAWMPFSTRALAGLSALILCLIGASQWMGEEFRNAGYTKVLTATASATAASITATPVAQVPSLLEESPEPMQQEDLGWMDSETITAGLIHGELGTNSDVSGPAFDRQGLAPGALAYGEMALSSPTGQPTGPKMYKENKSLSQSVVDPSNARSQLASHVSQSSWSHSVLNTDTLNAMDGSQELTTLSHLAPSHPSSSLSERRGYDQLAALSTQLKALHRSRYHRTLTEPQLALPVWPGQFGRSGNAKHRKQAINRQV